MCQSRLIRRFKTHQSTSYIRVGWGSDFGTYSLTRRLVPSRKSHFSPNWQNNASPCDPAPTAVANRTAPDEYSDIVATSLWPCTDNVCSSMKPSIPWLTRSPPFTGSWQRIVPAHSIAVSITIFFCTSYEFSQIVSFPFLNALFPRKLKICSTYWSYHSIVYPLCDWNIDQNKIWFDFHNVIL